ncbi:hypothetical protein [Nocardia sp. NPDC050793]|uniref:hypothetical protein n=1 Tax=Nocardia sp. NPDC050793 TaxID=3155159 RepID=UPI0033CE36CB
MATRKKPAPPKGLKPGGRKLWNDVLSNYALRPDDLRVLKDACFESDLIDDLVAAMRTNPLIIPGSMGQDVVHPIVTELRQHRATLGGLLRQLKLPDLPAEGGETVPGATPNQHRAAANSRWATRGRSA